MFTMYLTLVIQCTFWAILPEYLINRYMYNGTATTDREVKKPTAAEDAHEVSVSIRKVTVK